MLIVTLAMSLLGEVVLLLLLAALAGLMRGPQNLCTAVTARLIW
jgi:hypothetical protein